MSPSSRGSERIFVAEDDPPILELLVARLEIAGYRVASASDGASALRLILASPPALVILDVNMPGLDGFGVLRALRGDAACAGTPVLMLTARKSAADVRLARDLGASEYLAKPFEDRQLLARVQRLLQSRRTSQLAGKSAKAEEEASFLI